LREKILSLEADLKIASANHTGAEKDLDFAIMCNGRFYEINDAQRAEIEAQSDEIEAQSAEIEAQRAEIKSLSAKNEAQSAEIEAQSAENGALRAEIEALKTRVTDVKAIHGSVSQSIKQSSVASTTPLPSRQVTDL